VFVNFRHHLWQQVTCDATFMFLDDFLWLYIWDCYVSYQYSCLEQLEHNDIIAYLFTRIQLSWLKPSTCIYRTICLFHGRIFEIFLWLVFFPVWLFFCASCLLQNVRYRLGHDKEYLCPSNKWRQSAFCIDLLLFSQAPQPQLLLLSHYGRISVNDMVAPHPAHAPWERR